MTAMTWADGILEEEDRSSKASSSARVARKGREVSKHSFTWHPLRGTTSTGVEEGAYSTDTVSSDNAATYNRTEPLYG